MKVVTDADLAEALGLPNNFFIAFYKRNAAAFAPEAVYTLTEEERRDFVQNYCSTHAEKLRYAKRLPYIFTQKAVMQILCMRARSETAKILREKFFNLDAVTKLDLEDIFK
jgi:hypothetical protein